MSERTCSRGVDTSLCANTGTNGADQACCLHCSSAACKNEEADWATGDTDCITKGGKCQFNTLTCSGGGKDYRQEYKCGGPVERQCCAPKTLPPTQPPTQPPIPTVPTDKVPVDPNAGGKSGGQTAGIVIGVMFAIVVVMGQYPTLNNQLLISLLI